MADVKSLIVKLHKAGLINDFNISILVKLSIKHNDNDAIDYILNDVMDSAMHKWLFEPFIISGNIEYIKRIVSHELFDKSNLKILVSIAIKHHTGPELYQILDICELTTKDWRSMLLFRNAQTRCEDDYIYILNRIDPLDGYLDPCVFKDMLSSKYFRAFDMVIDPSGKFSFRGKDNISILQRIVYSSDENRIKQDIPKLDNNTMEYLLQQLIHNNKLERLKYVVETFNPKIDDSLFYMDANNGLGPDPELETLEYLYDAYMKYGDSVEECCV